MPDDREQNILYPFELVLEGTPLSLQARADSRRRWKDVVRSAAQVRARATDEIGFLYACPVALTIYYLPAAPMPGDVDNIVKPIMDALIDVAYRDDRFVERVSVQKFEPDEDWAFDNPSDQLARALELPSPVVYIRVDDDLSWRTAP